MSDITVSCPAAISTATNRSKLSAIWSSQEWKDFVAFHTNRIGKCEQCGKREGDIAINADGEGYTVHLTVDHPFRWSYKTPELYLDFEKAMCRVVCRTCNSCLERGLDICPSCKTNYKNMREPICRTCLFIAHPEARLAFEKGQAEQKDRQNARNTKKRRKANPHSCKFHGLTGITCSKSSGAICEHNTRNAPKKCLKFKARVKL
jgi:hypothetical protein